MQYNQEFLKEYYATQDEGVFISKCKDEDYKRHIIKSESFKSFVKEYEENILAFKEAIQIYDINTNMVVELVTNKNYPTRLTDSGAELLIVDDLVRYLDVKRFDNNTCNTSLIRLDDYHLIARNRFINLMCLMNDALSKGGFTVGKVLKDLEKYDDYLKLYKELEILGHDVDMNLQNISGKKVLTLHHRGK